MVKSLFLRSSTYFTALLFVKVFSTILFLLLARLLFKEEFGTLSYFLTLNSLITIIADWGLVQWYQVNFKQDKESSLLVVIGAARWVTLFVSICFFLVYALFVHPFSITLTCLFVILLTSEAFLSVSDGYYLVQKQTLKIAFKQLTKYLVPLLMSLILFSTLSTTTVLIGFVLSSLLTCFWYVPKKIFSIRSVSLLMSIQTLKQSSAFAGLILTSALYSRGDAIVIESSLGRSALGVYSAAYRYLDALSMFPSAFAQSFFHISANQKELTLRKVSFITIIMAGIGIIVGGILFQLSSFLTTSFLGQSYIDAQPVVSIFSVVVVLLFINSPLSTIVQSSAQLKSFLPWGVLNTISNIILNIFLVPIYGIVGAAFVMLVTEVSGLLINTYFVYRRMKQT